MALSANMAWEARADGDNANGGAFKIGASGTDRCQQAAAHATLTTASVVHSTTTQLNVSAGDYTVAAADVGNVVYVQGGSATTGRYEITAVDTGNNRWTVDRSLGTAGQTCPGKMGGAIADPEVATNGGSNLQWVAGNTLWIRNASGTFSKGDTWLVAGGLTGQYTTAARGNRIIGYNSVRGDMPTGTDRPLIDATAGNTIVLQVSAEVFVENLRIDCNALASSQGIFAGVIGRYFNIYVTDFKVTGFNVTSAHVILVDCEADASAASATGFGFTMAGGLAVGCWSHDHNVSGFSLSNNANTHMVRCLSTKNTGATSDGVIAGYHSTIEQSTFHGNGRDGIRYEGGFDYMRLIRGNLCTSNAGYGINFPSGLVPKSPHLDYNGFWNNTSGETNGLSDTGGSHTSGDYTPSNVSAGGDPYKDASTDDFRLNETDGADLWGMGPFPFVDIGAFQHDPDDEPVVGGGGMLRHPGMTGGLV